MCSSILEQILDDGNLEKALKRVKRNKGASGIDRMPVEEIDEYFKEHKEEIKASIREMRYEPRPVRSVYIPKKEGRIRGLGIPTVADRVIQQAVAQVFETIYDPAFSEHSYGFRPDRSAHDAMEEVLMHLNEGYEWVIDLDIEKYFDTVNHDRLISCIREKVNEKEILHLIRRFLKAGIMEDGVIQKSEAGTPQGGPLSPILSNIYLDKMDKELENRGLCAVRYADDCDIFVKSEMAANRVMKSITGWLEMQAKPGTKAEPVSKDQGSDTAHEGRIKRNRMDNHKDQSDRKRMDQLFRDGIDERISEKVWGMAQAQDQGYLSFLSKKTPTSIGGGGCHFKQWNDPLEYYQSKTQG